MTTATANHASPLYAVIDLGSNSFHMLITRMLANSIQTVDKVKRKVRLASGLDSNNMLTAKAMARGIECLSFFAERLQDIPSNNIKIVATATLRIANNADEFLALAEQTLGHKIELLSGKQEAEQIYLGVAHTHDEQDKKLVLDIGGASTELVIGEGFNPLVVTSLDMGCVTFKQKFFPNGKITPQHFDNAISAAKNMLAPVISQYQALGWHKVYGGSGTMQALAELLNHRGQAGIISQEFLPQIKHELLAFSQIDDIAISGLSKERTPVIVSGVAILMALFETLELSDLSIACGALREGLLYEMLPETRKLNIRQRTLNALAVKFHIDTEQANRVCQLADDIYQQVLTVWPIPDDNLHQILLASCALHEIGLLLEFKKHPQHGAYIISQSDLPGFSVEEKQLLAMLIANQKQAISLPQLAQQKLVSPEQTSCLLTILRLAILLSGRRKDDVLPHIEINSSQCSLKLQFDEQWLAQHPLIVDELKQECDWIAEADVNISFNQPM